MLRTDNVCQKLKFKTAAAAILNFAKSGILGYWATYINPYITNIYQCTKFDENILLTTEISPKIEIQDGGRSTK